MERTSSPGFFWGSRDIEEHFDDIIESTLPKKKRRFEDAACELHLGLEAYVSGDRTKTLLDRNGMVAIEPGQIALLITEEIIRLPLNVLGFISLKTSVKLPGLINVSGFHVDPGFEGRLVFTVYNAGTETYAYIRGQPMFLIWFAQLNEFEAGAHNGKRQGQMTIPAADISRLTAAGASPAKLDTRIRRLEVTEKVFGTLLLGLLLAVASLFIRSQF